MNGKYIRIGVFLSANEDIPEPYRAAARQFGEWIGKTGRTLVFGGSNRGLMQEIASAAKGAGGHLVGIVPQVLFDRGWNSSLLDETVHTRDLTDRKEQLVAQSDILVALPGGIGTLDEVFTAAGFAAIGFEAKPVVVYNVEGCYDALRELLENLSRNGLLRARPEEIIAFADSFEELTEILNR